MSQSEVLKENPFERAANSEMYIRLAEESDIPAIIEVLKASLGESRLKKTQEIWRHKHIDNPFGESLVLLAIEKGKVIGVRAFMLWSWQIGAEKYSAYRAVDTATHPDHQGKGVFKKLTLRAIELGLEAGDDFIFNTPNNQSLRGYLKMDWKKVGKLRVRLMPISPLNWKAARPAPGYMSKFKCEPQDIQSLCDKHNASCEKQNTLFTPKSLAYLNWRYEDNPLQGYEVMAEKDYYLAGYVKDHGRFKEFRVVEHLYENAAAFNVLKRKVKRLAKLHAAHFVSMGNLGRATGSFAATGNFGPTLTFRNISLDAKEADHYLDLKNWSYSLGDLELF